MTPPPEKNTSPQIPPNWDHIAASQEFQHLLSIKRLFIIPAFAFFFVYYFLLPILIGYAPDLMSSPIIGSLTLAYIYAISQFFVGWIIAWLYLRASSKFDRLAKDILARVADQPGGK